MASRKLYRRQRNATLHRDSRGVVAWKAMEPEGTTLPTVLLRCPCGERTIKVVSPPHTIQYEGGGLLTIKGSIGTPAGDPPGRPQNWCHFYIEGGKPRMCEDAQCPGAKTQ